MQARQTDNVIGALLNRRMLICVMTGLASGMPLYLLIQLVPAWLRAADVSLAEIGLFALVGLPYTWKCNKNKRFFNVFQSAHGAHRGVPDDPRLQRGDQRGHHARARNAAPWLHRCTRWRCDASCSQTLGDLWCCTRVGARCA